MLHSRQISGGEGAEGLRVAGLCILVVQGQSAQTFPSQSNGDSLLQKLMGRKEHPCLPWTRQEEVEEQETAPLPQAAEGHASVARIHPQRVRDMSTCSEQVPVGILLIWFATEIIKSTPMSRIHTKGQTQIFQRKSVARVRGARRSSTRRRQRRGCRCQRCRWRSGRCPAHGLLWRRRERVQLEVFFGA